MEHHCLLLAVVFIRRCSLSDTLLVVSDYAYVNVQNVALVASVSTGSRISENYMYWMWEGGGSLYGLPLP